MKPTFHKYQASGNDMIVIDPRQFDILLTAEVARLLCDRHFGIGADGICYGPLPGTQHPPAMRFFNPDGSEAEKSGNGLRIFARYLWDTGLAKTSEFSVAIGGESIPVRVLDRHASTISLGMGRLRFGSTLRFDTDGRSLEIHTVSIGNPHAVLITEDLEQIHSLGPVLECAPEFSERTNVQLMRHLGPHNIQIAIWERGAGHTLASGTSCCAAAGVAIRMGLCQSPVEVQMAGGNAHVIANEEWDVELEGPVLAVYQGVLSADVLKRLGE